MIQVELGLYQAAQLQCSFRGFPDTIQWKHHGVVLDELSSGEGYHYMWRRELQEDDGIVISHLDIQSLYRADLGWYTCSGKNSFGEHSATIELQSKS